MTRRKTLLQSTNEPVPISESDFSPQPDAGGEFELDVKGNPQVPLPSARPAAKPTVAANPADPRQGMAAPPADPRQTIAQPLTDVRQTMAQRPAAAPAMPYRSVNRPPMGLLIALDDGCADSGEEWRIRRTRIIIGRTAGDVVIPHDVDMSGEHAEISCSEKDGGYEWQLKDLKSTNGTFLRAQRFVLRNGKEVLLGGRRYIFRHPGVVSGDAGESGRHAARVTQAYQPAPSDVEHQLAARLIELTAKGEGREFLLGGAPSLFGSNSGCCQHVVSGDPFLDPEHARFYQDNRGRWVIEDRGSLNGLWVRVERVTLDRASEFQLGGQRFRFRVP